MDKFDIKKLAQEVAMLLGFTPKNRAVSLPNVYTLVYTELDKQMQADGVWRALIDVYLDGAEMFAVISVNGLLYKSSLMATPQGAQLGELTLVEIDYKPVAQGLRVMRQADGKYRWFAFPAATAVLNRSGELDSRELFQSFVTRIESGEVPYPFLSFYHVGEQIVMGKADFVAAEGYTYLASGLFAEDALSQAMRQKIETEDNKWGTSIGYYYMPDTVERLAVAEGISIPVYTDGVNHEISILEERDAACLYTGIFVQKEGVTNMNDKTLKKLKEVAGENPEALAIVEDLEQKVDGINEEIASKNLVRRENTDGQATAPVADHEPVAPVADPEPVAPVTPTMEMTDEAMDALAERVVTKMQTAFDEQLRAVDDKHTLALASQQAVIDDLTKRIAALETPMEQVVTQAIEDMPRNTIRVGYRPTNRQANQPVEEFGSLADLAAETLAAVK